MYIIFSPRNHKMSVAYIKFLEGPERGRKVIVPLSKFKNKIVDNNFDQTKKYFVQTKDDDGYYKAQNLFIYGVFMKTI